MSHLYNALGRALVFGAAVALSACGGSSQAVTAFQRLVLITALSNPLMATPTPCALFCWVTAAAAAMVLMQSGRRLKKSARLAGATLSLDWAIISMSPG